jgi:hypothetical protein
MAVENEHIITWVAISTALITAVFGVFGQWLKQKIAGQQDRDKDRSTAGVQGQQNVFAAYDSLVKGLQEDTRVLRKEFKEMQIALAACERLHREDATKIEALQNQNDEQARRIRALEARLPEIDSDDKNDYE